MWRNSKNTTTGRYSHGNTCGMSGSTSARSKARILVKKMTYAAMICFLQAGFFTAVQSYTATPGPSQSRQSAAASELTSAEELLLTLPFAGINAAPTTIQQRIESGIKNGKKAFLVVFWAPWCPPCMKKMPSLQKLIHSQSIPDLDVIAISLDALDANVIERGGSVLSNNKETIYYSADSAKMRSVMKALSFNGIPAFVVLSKKGKILIDSHYWSRITDWTDPRTIDDLRRLINEPSHP